MSGPLIVTRAALPVARQAIPRISAWVATARVSSLQSFKEFLKNHPAVASTIASIGVSGVIDAAMNGDPDSIQALNDAAAHVGIDTGGNTGGGAGGFDNNGGNGSTDKPGFLDRASDAIGSLFADDSSVEINADEAARIEQLRDLARFVRSEVSSSPEYVIRYHTMMREFMDMDAESVKNLVRAF